jgi:hypothetical protein
VFYATRYAVVVATLVAAAWMLVALFSKKWTQVSVFTLGIAVPWALFNATTRKREMGRRVWTEPPPAIMISVVSLAVAAAYTVAMEFLARWIILGKDSAFSDFSQLYLKRTDWLVLACALAVAFLAPFLLKVGAEWSKPSSRRRGREAPSLQEAEEIRKALTEKPWPAPGEPGEPAHGSETPPVLDDEPGSDRTPT